jgi:hypothetical protein
MEILESLLEGLRCVCAGFSDARHSTDAVYSMADIGLSAFSLFFMQSESFLSHQRRLEQGHGTSNCHTLFGMKKIPTEQDGAEKQDCERNAAKRWLNLHGKRLQDLRPVYLGDALFSCQSLAEAVLATGAEFLFVCKRDGHKTLYEYVDGAAR